MSGRPPAPTGVKVITVVGGTLSALNVLGGLVVLVQSIPVGDLLLIVADVASVLINGATLVALYGLISLEH